MCHVFHPQNFVPDVMQAGECRRMRPLLYLRHLNARLTWLLELQTHRALPILFPRQLRYPVLPAGDSVRAQVSTGKDFYACLLSISHYLAASKLVLLDLGFKDISLGVFRC